MKPTTMYLSAVALLVSGTAAAQSAPGLPTLMLPSCPEATMEPGEQKCFPVLLEGRSAPVASIGYTLKYDTAALRLPNGKDDINPGVVLIDRQSHTEKLNEDVVSGINTVQVSITPPTEIPIPTISDGEISRICFTVPDDAPVGCSMLELTTVDMGDDQGRNMEIDFPGNGGIQIGHMEPDHYQCYKARTSRKEPRFEKRNVHLQDQFETRITTVVKPTALCNPADKNGEGIFDQATHLEAYQIRDAKVCSDNNNPCRNRRDCSPGARCAVSKHGKKAGVRVDNQFGTLILDTVKPDRLLVPTTKDLNNPVESLNPDDHEVDHFKCYKVKVKRRICEDDPTVRCRTDADCQEAGLSGSCNLGFPRGVQATISDQFTEPPKVLDVKKPTRLCNPVNKNDEGIKPSGAHLMCYQVKPARGELKHKRLTGVYVNNQFGPERLDIIKEEELCVPSEKVLMER